MNPLRLETPTDLHAVCRRETVVLFVFYLFFFSLKTRMTMMLNEPLAFTREIVACMRLGFCAVISWSLHQHDTDVCVKPERTQGCCREPLTEKEAGEFGKSVGGHVCPHLLFFNTGNWCWWFILSLFFNRLIFGLVV